MNHRTNLSARPVLEALEDRSVPTFLAAAFPGQGVWGYNDGWRQLTAANASLVAADPYGHAIAEIPGQGVWLDDGFTWLANHRQQRLRPGHGLFQRVLPLDDRHGDAHLPLRGRPVPRPRAVALHQLQRQQHAPPRRFVRQPILAATHGQQRFHRGDCPERERGGGVPGPGPLAVHGRWRLAGTDPIGRHQRGHRLGPQRPHAGGGRVPRLRGRGASRTTPAGNNSPRRTP